jgi:hypothetical protein
MVGREVYYMDNNSVKKSDIVATELREIDKNSDVIYTLRSGKKILKSRACFSLSELFIQLKQDFEMLKNS